MEHQAETRHHGDLRGESVLYGCAICEGEGIGTAGDWQPISARDISVMVRPVAERKRGVVSHPLMGTYRAQSGRTAHSSAHRNGVMAARCSRLLRRDPASRRVRSSASSIVACAMLSLVTIALSGGCGGQVSADPIADLSECHGYATHADCCDAGCLWVEGNAKRGVADGCYSRRGCASGPAPASLKCDVGRCVLVWLTSDLSCSDQIRLFWPRRTGSVCR